MSVEFSEGAPDSAQAAQAMVDAAELRAAQSLSGAIDDFFLADSVRLDDESRAEVSALLWRMIADVVGDIRGALTEGLRDAVGDPDHIAARLGRAGLLRDADLMAELIERTRQTQLSDHLLRAPLREGEPSLLVRLAECADAVVAEAARDLLRAESARRAGEGGTELSAELHHRLVWWVAAAVHENAGHRGTDQDFAQAALLVLGRHDEGASVEVHAGALANAIDARPAEFGELLIAALGDGRVALFVAVLAHGAHLPFAICRTATLDPGADRLCLILRAQGVERTMIADIALHLAQADRRRDVSRLSALLDRTFAIDREDALHAVAALRVPSDFRRARLALVSGDGK